MLVEIDDEMAIEMLVERVEFWTSDYKVINLFRKMYESYVYGGVFESGKFNVMEIVDNDYINWTRVIGDDEEDFDDEDDMSDEDFDDLEEIDNEEEIGGEF